MITSELARFIASGISVLVGTRDARLRPDCVWAAGILAHDWAFVGVPRKATLAMNSWPAFTVRLRAETLFEQTPGPGAGHRRTPEDGDPVAWHGGVS